ncbi:MAG: hypothetical protein KUG58_07540 [Marinosulfonomonas sp.]|nr:hypothetical protein [Marinosulfonomonas sp.]
MTFRNVTLIFGSIGLVLAAILVIFGLITGATVPAIAALGLVFFYMATTFHTLKFSALLMSGAALIAAVLFVVLGRDIGALIHSAGRITYLPALIIVLSVFRAAAQNSPIINVAGRYIVNQPPSRRYLLLTSGANVLCVLLNVGGFALLHEIGIRAVRQGKEKSQRIIEIQDRRITRATLIGFSSTFFWSPFGLSLNLCLAFLPGTTWLGFAPIGIAISIVFIAIGWLLDRLERSSGNSAVPVAEKGGAKALIGMLLMMVMLTGTAVLGEQIFHIPLQAVILIIIPLFAFLWAMSARFPEKGAFAEAGNLAVTAFRQLPSIANEVAILTAASCLGLLVAGLLPPEFVAQIMRLAEPSPSLLGAGIMVTIFALAIVGINPMVPATAILTAAVSTDVQISAHFLMAAIIIGWAASMTISPTTATIAIASSRLNKNPFRVGLGWNGPFGACVVAVGVLLMFLWV